MVSPGINSGRPRDKPNLPVAFSPPPNSKAPYTSSECKILSVISNSLTFAGILTFCRVLWGPLRILHPLWQGKGEFLRLISEAAPIDLCFRI